MSNDIEKYWDEMKLFAKERSGRIERLLNTEVESSIFMDIEERVVGFIIGVEMIGIHLPRCNGVMYKYEEGKICIYSFFTEGDIFFKFVQQVINKISTINEEKIIIQIIESELKAWKNFFNSHKSNGLSRELEVGLFGEILTINKLLELGYQDVIESWVGPNKKKIDFELYSIDIETKTISNKEELIYVHGVEQLLSTKQLYLDVWRIEEDEYGYSIHDLVGQVVTMIERRDVFYKKLALVGYSPDDENLKKYHLIKNVSYYISHDFPKIYPRDNIINVNYCISLSGLEKFILDIPSRI